MSSCERSGTNLVRSILETSEEILTLNATGFSHYVYRVHVDSNRTLNNWDWHLTNCVHLLNRYAQEDGQIYDLDELRTDVKPWDIKELLLYPARKRARKSSQCIVIKEHEAWRLIGFFQIIIPGSKVILLHRHPAGFYASCKKLKKRVPCYFGTINRALQQWENAYFKSLSAVQALPREKYHIIWFEDIIATDSRSTINNLFSFLGVSRPKEWSCYYVKNKEILAKNRHLDLMWQNLDQPIDPSRIDAWERSLKTWEVSVISKRVPDFFLDDQRQSSFWLKAYAKWKVMEQTLWLQLVNLWIFLQWLFKGRCLISWSEYQGYSIRSRKPFEVFRDKWIYQFSDLRKHDT